MTISADHGDGRAPDRPVLLGCVGMVVAVGLVIFGGVLFVGFLESGSDTGHMKLRDAESYAPGSAEFVGERNFFLVRLPEGDFLAVADLDAANRAASGRRCRVQLTQADTAENIELIEQYRGRFSADAGGAAAVFREDCNGVVYDIAGKRLTGEGRNLDRYPVTIDGSGFVVVDVSRRECSTAAGSVPFQAAACETP